MILFVIKPFIIKRVVYIFSEAFMEQNSYLLTILKENNFFPKQTLFIYFYIIHLFN